MKSLCVLLSLVILCVAQTIVDAEPLEGANEVGRETFVVSAIPTKVLNLVHDFELTVST